MLFHTPAINSGFVHLKGYSINYELHGSGPKRIMLVMGFKASMGLWKDLVKHFSSKATFLVFDNRGVGKSVCKRFERFTTSGMARDALAILDHVGCTFSLILQGQSPSQFI